MITEIVNKENKCIDNNILINFLNIYTTKYDQCFFINQINDDLNNITKKNMNIYQFIMGSGKSTTIIPFLLYKNW